MQTEIDKPLKGRVIVVTGAGRGIGAAYAEQAAVMGASVVVNDLGRGLNNQEEEISPANEVVERINAAGGQAVADLSDVSSFDGANDLIKCAIDNFGDLDVVINNAGILRDRMIVNMSESEWDDVVRVHLKGHFCVSKFAASYWRERSKSTAGDPVLIQTTSIAGLHGNVGQVNYASAKAGIATMAHLLNLELNARYGVRSYAIAPSARTRLTLNSPGAVDAITQKTESGFDFFAPENVAPFVLWLAKQGCPMPSGGVFGVEGDRIRRYDSWRVAKTIRCGEQWSFNNLDAQFSELADGHENAFQPIEEVMSI